MEHTNAPKVSIEVERRHAALAFCNNLIPCDDRGCSDLTLLKTCR